MNKTVILFDANILIDYQYERRYVIERLALMDWIRRAAEPHYKTSILFTS